MSLETETKPLVEVKDYLDKLLNVSGMEADSNGLVVGGRPMVAKVGLAVNCSLQAIESAHTRRCDLLLTHHAAWKSTDAHAARTDAQHLVSTLQRGITAQTMA